jgi:hypothetical protein
MPISGAIISFTDGDIAARLERLEKRLDDLIARVDTAIDLYRRVQIQDEAEIRRLYEEIHQRPDHELD